MLLKDDIRSGVVGRKLKTSTEFGSCCVVEIVPLLPMTECCISLDLGCMLNSDFESQGS
jgi:hypothetical protein